MGCPVPGPMPRSTWSATLYAVVPPELLERLAPDTPREFEAVIGRSDGKAYPTFIDALTGAPLPSGDVWARSLREAWDGHGPTGTGCIGEVRDMLWAMGRFADQGGYRLEVPPETERKAQEEARASQPPEGAVH